MAIGRTNASSGGSTDGYILDLCGTLSFSGIYGDGNYVTISDCRLACNGGGEVILVMRSGVLDTYENIEFRSTSLPSGVSLVKGGHFGATGTTKNYYCCVLTGVTGKLNVNCDYSERSSTYDVVYCDITASYA